MKDLVEALASDACAGRATGTPGGLIARGMVVEALRDAGADPFEQAVPACRGANVLASIPGDVDRWILIAAHYDHLGTLGGKVYPGADDNAAAVAIAVEVARGLAAKRPSGRGVIIAAFDAEEPPHYLTGSMGSEYWARHPTTPLAGVDLMVCMDLVGHAIGPEGTPDEVRNTIFALGAERCAATASILESTPAEDGLFVRRMGADVVPPLSDYAAFWQRKRPFVFLSNGRSQRYHTPEDVPAHVDYRKMSATARWLERTVRAACAADTRFDYVERRDDASTLDSFIAVAETLRALSPQAELASRAARQLRATVRKDGSVPEASRPSLEGLVAALEEALG